MLLCCVAGEGGSSMGETEREAAGGTCEKERESASERRGEGEGGREEEGEGRDGRTEENLTAPGSC